MVHRIQTRAELVAFIEAAKGYLYNDFGGRDPKMCPIHHASCHSLLRMLAVREGRLSVRKLCSASLPDLIAEVVRQGKVYSLCGNEKLAAGGTPASNGRSARLAPRPARPSIDSSSSDCEFEVVATAASREVEVWSSYRLPYDSKPRTKRLKEAIGGAVRGLEARNGEMLCATYTSANPDSVDVENVLLYNVGPGCFAAATREGLRVERVFGGPPQQPGRTAVAEHYHRYAVVPCQTESEHWRRGETRVRLSGVPIPRLEELSKPDEVWRAVRERAATTPTHAGPYGLAITLTTANDSVCLSRIVKPLVDGLVAGLHAHDGTDLDVVSTRLAQALGMAVGEVRRLLMEPQQGVLGVRRLLWARANGYQWNPDDERCVTCTLLGRSSPGKRSWQVDFELFAVTPR